MSNARQHSEMQIRRPIMSLCLSILLLGMSTKLSVQCLFKHRSKFAVGNESKYVSPRTACVSSMCQRCALADAIIYKCPTQRNIQCLRQF